MGSLREIGQKYIPRAALAGALLFSSGCNSDIGSVGSVRTIDCVNGEGRSTTTVVLPEGDTTRIGVNPYGAGFPFDIRRQFIAGRDGSFTIRTTPPVPGVMIEVPAGKQSASGEPVTISGLDNSDRPNRTMQLLPDNSVTFVDGRVGFRVQGSPTANGQTMLTVNQECVVGK